MKKINIIYWISTVLFALFMLGSAIPDILCMPIAIKGMHDDLGYPVYFIPFIGVAKLLGVIALFIPGFPRVREWVYAGFAFDLLGAIYSVIAVKASAPENWLPMLLPIAVGAVSYIYYHKRLKAQTK